MKPNWPAIAAICAGCGINHGSYECPYAEGPSLKRSLRRLYPSAEIPPHRRCCEPGCESVKRVRGYCTKHRYFGAKEQR